METIRPAESDAPSKKGRRVRKRELQRRIAGQMRQPGNQLSEEVWKRLEEDCLLDDFLDLDDSEAGFMAVLRDARTYNAAFRAEQRRGRVNRRRAGVRLPSSSEIKGVVDLSKCLEPEELKRAEILTGELGRFAESHALPNRILGYEADRPLVAQFRDKYLGGRVLSEAEAQQFGRSIGIALFDLEFFQEHGIPVVGHSSGLSSPRDWEAEDSRLGLTPRIEVFFQWADRWYFDVIGDRAKYIEADHNLVGVFALGREIPSVVGRDSILYRLQDLAIHLSAVCPWKVHQSARFILTGQPPHVLPIDFGIPDHSRGSSHACVEVSLAIQPWLSRPSLLRVYRELQRILIGPRNRPPTMKSLQFYEFVAEQRQRDETFSSALSAWLLRHPAERKRYPKGDATSVSRFASQFRDIERQILRPFGHPDFKERKS